MPFPEINLFHSAPCNPHVNAEQESDIVDHHQSSRQVMENDEIYEIPRLDLPTRPTSRLGFNTVTLSEPPPCSPLAGTCGGQWTPALLQRGAKTLDPPADSMDITTCSSPSFGGQVSPMTSFSALNSQPHHQRKEEKQAEYGPEEIDSSLFPCKDRPRTAPSVALQTQTVAKTSVSRLSFPFNSTSARRRRPPPPPPPIRRSYSSLPSPLSPTPIRPFSKINQPTRHNYHHHGHSNQRLQYLKWFWSMREHDPDALVAQAGDDNAHGGPQKIPIGIYLPSYPPRRSPAQPKSQQCVLPPITIHPRRGDISALRDPYCVYVDRCFAALPLWTIGKTLWMFDVHMLCEGPTDDGAVELDDDDFDETASEISTDTTSSIVSSDDSDATLVESGSEGDLVEYQERHTKAKDAELEPVDSPHKKGRHYLGFVSANKMRLRSELGFSADHAWSRPSELKPTRLNARSSWASNWYRRWEVLIELSGSDRERQATLFGFIDAPVGLTSRAEATSKQLTKFFLAEDEAQDDDALNCVDNVEQAPSHFCG